MLGEELEAHFFPLRLIDETQFGIFEKRFRENGGGSGFAIGIDLSADAPDDEAFGARNDFRGGFSGGVEMDIPAFCAEEIFHVSGAIRLDVEEVNGFAKEVMHPGIQLESRPEVVWEERKALLELCLKRFN